MEIIQTQKYIRMSPKKIRPVVRMLSKLSLNKVMEVLPYIKKRGAEPLEKVLKSAIGNAKQRGVGEDDLILKEIQVTEGPRLKRGRPVSRGMWHPYKKRMSHIRVILETGKKETKEKVQLAVKTGKAKLKDDTARKKEGTKRDNS